MQSEQDSILRNVSSWSDNKESWLSSSTLYFFSGCIEKQWIMLMALALLHEKESLPTLLPQIVEKKIILIVFVYYTYMPLFPFY